MKKRTAFIGAILSLIPLGQPLLRGTGIALISSAVIHSLSAKAEPNYANYFYKKGLKKYDQDDFRGALPEFTKAIKINSEYGDAYYYRGRVKKELLDIKGAIEDYKKAIKINPNDGRAYYDRAILYSSYNRVILKEGQKRDVKGAIKDYTKAIKINPNDVVAY